MIFQLIKTYEKLPTKCQSQECDWQGEARLWDTHNKTCDQVIVACCHMGCTKSGERLLMLQHKEICPFNQDGTANCILCREEMKRYIYFISHMLKLENSILRLIPHSNAIGYYI